MKLRRCQRAQWQSTCSVCPKSQVQSLPSLERAAINAIWNSEMPLPVHVASTELDRPIFIPKLEPPKHRNRFAKTQIASIAAVVRMHKEGGTQTKPILSQAKGKKSNSPAHDLSNLICKANVWVCGKSLLLLYATIWKASEMSWHSIHFGVFCCKDFLYSMSGLWTISSGSQCMPKRKEEENNTVCSQKLLLGANITT